MVVKAGGASAVEKYLNVGAAARYLSVSRTTLYKLIQAGELITYGSAVNRSV